MPLADLSGWDAAIKANTKLLFVESPSNPLAELVDIAALSEVAHAKGAMLIVDNCFCTPALQQPLKLGADTLCTRPPSSSTARAVAWVAWLPAAASR